jgi:hypothetical protein
MESNNMYVVYTWDINTKNKEVVLSKIEYKKFSSFEKGLEYVEKKSVDNIYKSIGKNPVLKEDWKEIRNLNIIGKTRTFYPPSRIF